MASEAASTIMCNPFAPLTTNSNNQQQEQQPLPPPAKKKRSLPGTPDPDAEVIALSPRTLLATNRFVCEICGKGFQRDQNLQLHRRGHNLPWKLRQRSSKEPRKRVYVCPEKSCVHHNPARALGDLTGIKKHFCRKHGEKKWKCDKCAKKYAVQSDWKAHAKTCGTREYRCDCGTIFSRRDSFITHRAFCDALAEETARLNAASSAAHTYLLDDAGAPPRLRPNMNMNMNMNIGTMMQMLPPPPAPSPAFKPPASVAGLSLWAGDIIGGAAPAPLAVPPQLYADLFSAAPPQLDGWLYGNVDGKLSSSTASELTTSAAATDSVPSVFSDANCKPAAPPADMSATALLHKAAQMGAVTSASGNANPPPLIVDHADAAAAAAAGAMLFGAASRQQLNNLTAATGNVAYGDVILSAVRHAGLKQDAVGREETRDFLGVGAQALCSSSLPLHGWI